MAAGLMADMPLTRKFPEEYCAKLIVWTPDPFRGQTHSSIGFRGTVPQELGEFLKAVMVAGGVTQGMEKALAVMTAELRGKVKKKARTPAKASPSTASPRKKRASSERASPRRR